MGTARDHQLSLRLDYSTTHGVIQEEVPSNRSRLFFGFCFRY